MFEMSSYAHPLIVTFSCCILTWTHIDILRMTRGKEKLKLKHFYLCVKLVKIITAALWMKS